MEGVEGGGPGIPPRSSAGKKGGEGHAASSPKAKEVGEDRPRSLVATSSRRDQRKTAISCIDHSARRSQMFDVAINHLGEKEKGKEEEGYGSPIVSPVLRGILSSPTLAAPVF